jgi:LDH2 family malate/lactate/ureidoglycolate dehydrogenase
MMKTETRIRHGALVDAIHQVLFREGVTESIGRVEADLMAEADLQGVPSHGVRMLPGLVETIRDGRCKANPQLVITRERGATCVLDCDHGTGRFTAVQAMSHAVDRAGKFGAGVCLALNTTHWGRAHAYACYAAQAGMIGLCTTNAIPNMLAWGSTRPLLGNNPLAIAVPRGPGRAPVVLDMAMSQAAVGKIGTYLREGKTVPSGWGLDASGQPTSDPSAILSSGLVLPMGEHKGAGLALMMEILTGALSGGLLSYEVYQVDSTGLDPEGSKFLLAIDVSKFVEPERFTERVGALLRSIAQGVGSDGEFLYPGQRGWQTRDRNLVEGVPIHGKIVEQLSGIGVTLSSIA